MVVSNFLINIESRGELDLVNITEKVSDIVRRAQIDEGLAFIAARSTTSSILICEDEEGLLQDIREALERIAPSSVKYKHDSRWGDGNGRSHVRASLIGQHVSVPISSGRLLLGTWQSIFFLELDVRPRKRIIDITIVH